MAQYIVATQTTGLKLHNGPGTNFGTIGLLAKGSKVIGSGLIADGAGSASGWAQLTGTPLGDGYASLDFLTLAQNANGIPEPTNSAEMAAAVSAELGQNYAQPPAKADASNYLDGATADLTKAAARAINSANAGTVHNVLVAVTAARVASCAVGPGGAQCKALMALEKKLTEAEAWLAKGPGQIPPGGTAPKMPGSDTPTTTPATTPGTPPAAASGGEGDGMGIAIAALVGAFLLFGNK